MVKSLFTAALVASFAWQAVASPEPIMRDQAPPPREGPGRPAARRPPVGARAPPRPPIQERPGSPAGARPQMPNRPPPPREARPPVEARPATPEGAAASSSMLSKQVIYDAINNITNSKTIQAQYKEITRSTTNFAASDVQLLSAVGGDSEYNHGLLCARAPNNSIQLGCGPNHGGKPWTGISTMSGIKTAFLVFGIKYGAAGQITIVSDPKGGFQPPGYDTTPLNNQSVAFYTKQFVDMSKVTIDFEDAFNIATTTNGIKEFNAVRLGAMAEPIGNATVGTRAVLPGQAYYNFNHMIGFEIPNQKTVAWTMVGATNKHVDQACLGPLEGGTNPPDGEHILLPGQLVGQVPASKPPLKTIPKISAAMKALVHVITHTTMKEELKGKPVIPDPPKPKGEDAPPPLGRPPVERPPVGRPPVEPEAGKSPAAHEPERPQAPPAVRPAEEAKKPEAVPGGK